MGSDQLLLKKIPFVQLISPYMINNTWIVISIASGFIDERDEGA